ncbi:MAG: hypothetical protein ACKO5V_07420, partial [Actinomycetota bacterium]
MKRLSILVSTLLIVGSSYLLGWSDLLPVKKVSIDEKNESIVKELTAKLAEEPNPILIGEP